MTTDADSNLARWRRTQARRDHIIICALVVLGVGFALLTRLFT